MNRPSSTLTPAGGLALAVATVALAVAPNLLCSYAKAAPAPVVATQAKGADLTGTWGIDRGHTEIGFSVVHLGVSKTRGRFTDFDGKLTVDGAKPENSSVVVNIRAASINTGDDNRDKHLRGPDFFDADKYPNLTFKSTGIKKSKGGEYIAYGNLTIKAATRPVTLRFKPTTPIKGPGGKLRAGLSTNLAIDRRDYGLTWNGVIEGTQAVGNEVAIQIELEAIKE
jgi:polyisoprenoid-binding protein YceI